MINISNTRSQHKQAIKELFAPIEYAAYGMPNVLSSERYTNIQLFEASTGQSFANPRDISSFLADRVGSISLNTEFFRSTQGRAPLTVNIMLQESIDPARVANISNMTTEWNENSPTQIITYEKQLSKAISDPRCVAVVFKKTNPTDQKIMPQYLILADKQGYRNQNDNAYLTRYLTLAIAIFAELLTTSRLNDKEIVPDPVAYYKRFYTSDVQTAVMANPIRESNPTLKAYCDDFVYTKSAEKLLKFIKPNKEPDLLDKIQRAERQLESLYQQMIDEENKKRRHENDLLAFRYSPAIDDNMIQSLRKIAKVANLNEEDMNLGSGQLVIRLKSHDVAVDQEAFKLIQKSTRSSDYAALSKANKALLHAIFIDQTYRLPIMGQLKITSTGEHTVERIGASVRDGIMCNPHYELHSCMGDSKALLQKAMISQDAINWLLLAKTAVGNINVTDGTVWAKFVRKLADRDYRDAIIYNRETGEGIKISEWLNNWEKEQKKIEDDKKIAIAEAEIRESLVVEVAPEPQPQPVPTYATVRATRRAPTVLDLEFDLEEPQTNNDPFDLPNIE